MIHRFALLATTAAIVAIPQIAQAGCSGSGCNSLTTTSNYSATEKKVRATVTNKDQTSPIHLKFCVNVDYHCNGFDVTLAPRETITKDVAYSGAKPPQIHGVDVVTADFPAARASSSGGAPGSASGSGASNTSGASVGLDTPRGKLMVLATKQSAVAPILAKVTDYFNKLGASYPEALDRARTMHELVEKLGPIRDVEVEVNKTKDVRVKDEAHIAKGAELQLKHFAQTLKLTKTSAEFAAANLKISEGDLQAARDMERARNLREEADRANAGFSAVLKVINQATDAVVLVNPESDPISKVNAAVATVQRAMDLVGIVDPLLEEAGKLESEAHRIGMDNAERKFTAAKSYMKSLKQQLGELQSQFAEYQDFLRNTRNTAEDSYDKLAKAPKSGNRFNFETLQKAIEACQSTVDYTRKTYEYAYGVRDQIKALGQIGDDSAWMAFPGEGRKTLNVMYEQAGPAFDWAVKERQTAEALLKRLNEMYQVARASMQ
jgi:tetratricopeptide (TPR) repeat protein